MKILIDLQSCQGENRQAGVGRFALSLCTAILAANRHHEFHLLVNGSFPESVVELRQHFVEWIPNDRVHVFVPAGRIRASDPGNEWRRATTATLRQGVVEGVAPDCVFLPSMFEGYRSDTVVSVPSDGTVPVVSMFYGIPWTSAAVTPRGESFAKFCAEGISNLSRVDGLLAISDHALRQAASYLNLGKTKATTVAACVGTNPGLITEEEDAAALDRLGIQGRYVLCSLGDFDSADAVQILLSSWAHLPRRLKGKYQLVAAEKAPSPETRRKLGLEAVATARHCSLVGRLATADFLSLCRKCELFVFISLHEGFSYALFEAACCGAPVIASNTSEAGDPNGGGEGLFDPWNKGEITQLLTRCLEDDAFRLGLRKQPGSLPESLTCADTAKRCLLYFDDMAAHLGKNTQNQRAAIDFDRIIARLSSLGVGAMPTDSDYVATAVALAAQIPRPGKPRLFIDISTLAGSDFRTGIHRVVRSMVKLLPDLVGEAYETKLVYGDNRRRFRQANTWLAGQSNYHGYFADEGDEVIDARKGDILLGLDFAPRLFPRFDAEVARLRALGMSIYFVVYDLIPLLHPEFFDSDLVEAFKNWIWSTTRHADGLLCISRSVSEDLRRWVSKNQPEENRALQIEWFHLGADFSVKSAPGNLPAQVEAVVETSRRSPSFLMVGTLEPRKGHAFVLDAFELLWHEGVDVNLVLVGRVGWKMDDFSRRLKKHSEKDRRLYWLDGVDDERLEAIYSESAALIAASFNEGFGLPLIEAAQRGLPVIARDIPVFREVGGEGAIYFDGRSPGSLAETVFRFLHDGSKQARAERVSRIKWLTWEQSARDLCSLIIGREARRKGL